MAIIYGTSGADTRTGTSDADTIYGYDPNASEIVGTRVASGLTQPLFVTGAPDDSGRLFIVGKQGTIHIAGTPAPFLDVTDQVSTAGEVGLLGFTFHPDFANNGKVYVFLSIEGATTNDPRHNQSQIREYTVNPNSPNVLDPNNYKVILETTEYTPFSGNHRAGWIGFHPTDGYLYVATGDGDQNAKAQDPTSHLGKILRLDVNGPDAFPDDAKKNFAIPEGNPTVFDNADDLAQPSEVYAIGFRNPWRASFGPDGRLFVADVGADTAEEINLVVPGANYGWGRQDNGDAPDDGPTPGENDGYTDPIHTYFHSDNIGSSITGGYVYSGPIAALQGKYVFGDFGSGRIWTLEQIGTNWVRTDITAMIVPSAGTIERIASFGTDRNGNLYVVDITGEVFRLDAGGGGSDLGDILNGVGGNDTIYGGNGNDTIDGGADNDHLYGDVGNDTLIGGSGDDIYYVDGGDSIVEGEGNYDEVRALASFILQDGQEIETLRTNNAAGTTALDLTGNEFSQALYGNAGSNILTGRGEDDTLDGGGGNDTLDGGSGYDVYYVDDGDRIVEAAGDTYDMAYASGSFTLTAGQEVELLAFFDGESTEALNLTGNELAQWLDGNQGDNVLNGGGGEDTIHGGGGNDTYVVDANDVIEEQDGGGIDTIKISVSHSLENYFYFENLTLLGNAANGTGNEADNIIVGNDVANTLDGLIGDDTLEGGGGDDAYTVDSAKDVIVEATGKGTDTLYVSADVYKLALGAEVEILELTATGRDLTGNELGNRLVGNSGSNRLDGGGGNDTLILTGNRSDYTITRDENGIVTVVDKWVPENGADTILNVEIFEFDDGSVSLEGLFNTAPSGVSLDFDVVAENSKLGHGIGRFSVVDEPSDTHTYRLTNNAGGRFTIDTATGVLKVADGVRLDYEQASEHTIEVVVTDASNESVTKSFKIVVQDVLDEQATGSDLADVMKGGSGRDSFNGAAGNDQLDSGAGHDTLFGGSGNDTLTGGAGNDSLSGEAGADRLEGGVGDDIYYVDGGDQVFEAANSGSDEIRTTESFTLQAGQAVEVLRAWPAESKAGLSISGNELSQNLIGNAGSNRLNGEAGNDRLSGGLGKDTFTGGKGRDVFVFDDRETGSSKSKADYITDFSGRSGDRIDLKAVDADTKKRGDQKFSFIGKDDAFSKAGEVRYEKTKSATYVYLNTDSDKSAEAVIKLKGSVDLSKSWFVL
ncbi:PQQ-dependent sugar dehydrogenase [Microvirga sp. CF3062]|uniref:PQQ-dependent sugar dehydrogenase n=1 Tax=Microvirga sp. CF3062 TaxID=3110182 RepID=UPI002E75CB3A|nr:PQQ-dependent sugar dehydrogenase [Microvirga sp. CF3062]MEE1658012.1 PQQ-dependent sugar dehydrogenase [Microvirga sp. CF3062]